jgi:outer membrane receptor for ferrienterochelin and colicins
MGYKLPTIFQDESEEKLFSNVLPIDAKIAKRELSLGGTLDLKVYAPSTNGFQISLNEMFFITNIWSPVLSNRVLY